MIHRLIAETARKLDTHATGRPFAAELRAARAMLPPHRAGPVRGLAYAPMIFADRPADAALFDAGIAAFPHANWSEFYAETPWSRPFLPRFATGECVRGDVILGLFILGPDTHYPAHAHPAEKFYIVLSGQAEFQNGAAAAFEAKTAGDMVFHASDASHAIRSGPRPLFAVYGWRGAITAPSWYRDDMADEAEPKKYPLSQDDDPHAPPETENHRPHRRLLGRGDRAVLQVPECRRECASWRLGHRRDADRGHELRQY